jgi:hypothetical protein
VSFTPRPLYPRYPLDGLGGPQSRSGRRGEEKILDPTGTRLPTPRHVVISQKAIIFKTLTCLRDKIILARPSRVQKATSNMCQVEFCAIAVGRGALWASGNLAAMTAARYVNTIHLARWVFSVGSIHSQVSSLPPFITLSPSLPFFVSFPFSFHSIQVK